LTTNELDQKTNHTQIVRQTSTVHAIGSLRTYLEKICRIKATNKAASIAAEMLSLIFINQAFVIFITYILAKKVKKTRA